MNVVIYKCYHLVDYDVDDPGDRGSGFFSVSRKMDALANNVIGAACLLMFVGLIGWLAWTLHFYAKEVDEWKADSGSPPARKTHRAL